MTGTMDIADNTSICAVVNVVSRPRSVADVSDKRNIVAVSKTIWNLGGGGRTVVNSIASSRSSDSREYGNADRMVNGSSIINRYA